MLRSDLLWDSRLVARKQVPTLQEALSCANDEALLAMVEQCHARWLPGWETETPQQRRVARKRMARALDAMRECTIESNEGRFCCVFPEERFVVHVSKGRNVIERVIQARVAGLDDPSMGRDGCQLFERLPWARALSYRVWLEGLQGCHERYMVLASAFWRLTHQGFADDAPSEARRPPNMRREVNRAPVSDRLGPSRGSMLPRRQCAFVFGGDDACAPSAPVDSVGRLRSVRAASMGLYVPDALEETYQDRLIARVELLNEACEKDFSDRVRALATRLEAA